MDKLIKLKNYFKLEKNKLFLRLRNGSTNTRHIQEKRKKNML